MVRLGQRPHRQSVTSVARLFQVPDQPWLPLDIRGRQIVVIDAAVLESSDAASRVLAPLRELGPELDTFDECSAASLVHLQIDPLEPTAVYANSVLLDDMPAAAVESLVAAAGAGSGSELLFVELRQLGGALARPAPRGGALDHMDGSFLVLGVGLDQGAGWAAVREDANRVLDSLQPWASASAYLLMADEAVDEQRGWPASAWQRLVEVRTAADPDGLFLSPRPAAKQG